MRQNITTQGPASGLRAVVPSFVVHLLELLGVDYRPGVFLPRDLQDIVVAYLIFAGRLRQSLTGSCSRNSECITSVCALRSGRVVSASTDTTLRVWNTYLARCTTVWEGHTAQVTSLCVLSNGWVISSSIDCTLRLWEPNRHGCVKVLNGHEGPVSSVCALSGNRVVSGAYDNTLRLWGPMASATCSMTLTGHTQGVLCVCALPDDRAISGACDKTLRIWDLKTGVCVTTLTGHTHTVLAVCALPVADGDTRVISASLNRSLRLWNPTTGECEKCIDNAAPPGPQPSLPNCKFVTTLLTLPDGRVLIGSMLAYPPDGSDSASIVCNKFIHIFNPTSYTFELVHQRSTEMYHSNSLAMALMPRADSSSVVQVIVGVDTSLEIWV